MQSIGFTRREELREERLGTFVPGVHSSLVSIKPLLRSPRRENGNIRSRIASCDTPLITKVLVGYFNDAN